MNEFKLLNSDVQYDDLSFHEKRTANKFKN